MFVLNSFSEQNVGSDPTGWTAVQDSNGVLHFGCHSLISYDGQRWTSSSMNGAYGLRGLDFAPDGRLWASAVGEIGWFDRQGAGWSYRSLTPELPFDATKLGEVWHVFSEGDGALFVTLDKILRWDGKAFQVWSMPGTLRLRAMRVGNKIYVHHRPTGLHVMTAEGPQKIAGPEALNDTALFLMEERNGGWLFATPRGLFNFVEGRLEPFAPEASAFIRREALTHAIRLPDGRLALSTARGGIALVHPDGSLDRILNEESGLPTRVIYSLFADRDGGLWATSATHIFRAALNGSSRFFDHRFGLPRERIFRVARHNGALTIATQNDVYSQPAGERNFQRLNALSGVLWDMKSTDYGLLVGRSRSVILWSDEKNRVLYSTTADPNLAKPSRTEAGATLISEQRSILAVDGAGQARVLVKNLPDTATSIAEARGQLWIGTTTRGVLVAQPNSTGPVEATLPNANFGLPKIARQGSTIATAKGTVFVLSPEGGWILPAGADRFQAIQNYPANRRLSGFFYHPADDSIWVIHAESGVNLAFVARITEQGNRAVWQPHSVDGLWTVGVPRCIFAEASATGTTLWIGGTNGLLRNEVPRELFAPVPRTPLLHAYSRAAETGQFHAIERALPYSTQAVRFEFAAPEFSRRSALRLETFIERIDRDWVAAEPSARRELTAMRDGHYTFRVRAVAETGVASEPAVFHFEILPPWWRTAPALIAVLLALAPGSYALYRLRVRALRRRNAELEQKVDERTAQLAKASAAKTEFVAGMSHDIRNPLNGIVGLALALEDTRLDRRQREIVATLRECTTYLSSLVDDVLDFATIESGHVELRPGPFAPAEVLRSVATTLKGGAAEEGAILLIEVDPKLPAILVADAGRIQQILVNYGSNALKYVGGTIRLVARLPENSPDEIEFAVIDEGPGLTAEETAQLFKKFSRLANAATPGSSGPIKGTGLGLAACRSLADIMGGSVGVDSKPGAGSRFFLRLPLTLGKSAEIAPTLFLPAATVLLVEDADYNAWAATAVLAKLGLSCERVHNGAQALQLFAERRFDIVLLDRNLPDMDGTEVARRIRELEADDRRAVVLAVTAYCTAEDRALCLAAGMDAFVGKPLTPQKLRRVLLAAGRRLLAAASVQVPATAESKARPDNVDLSMLTYLSDGSDEGLGEQIERFLAALAQSEEQLNRAAETKEFIAVADAAHHVLSQARMIGGTALEQACTALEQAARAKNRAAFSGLRAPVHAEIRAVTAALRHRHPAHHLT